MLRYGFLNILSFELTPWPIIFLCIIVQRNAQLKTNLQYQRFCCHYNGDLKEL